MPDRVKVSHTNFIWTEWVEPYGFLPRGEIGAHACVYYVGCAVRALENVDNGAWRHGEYDPLSRLNNLARGVAVMYGLDSPSDFLKFMPAVRLQFKTEELGWDPRVENPGAEQHHTH